MKKFVIKQYADKRTVWLSEAYVKEVCGVSDGYMKVARNRATKNKNASWQFMKMDGTYYYNHACVPNVAPNFYQEKFPTYIELVREAHEPTFAITTGMAKEKLRNEMQLIYEKSDVNYYMWEGPVSFPLEKAEALAQGLALHRAIDAVVKSGSVLRFGLCKIADFYQVAAELVAELGLYGFSTKSPMTLRHRIAAFPQDKKAQRVYMIPAKMGNSNAQVVGKETLVDMETGEVMKYDIHKTAILYLWMNIDRPNKLHKVAIFNDQYMPLMSELNVERTISYRTFCAHTDQLYTKVWASKERDGKHHFNTTYKTYVAAEQLKHSNSMWCADGSGWKLAYRNGAGAATLYALRIYDVASQAIIGWCVMNTPGESTEHFRQALAMAFQTSEGYAPLDFLSDNGTAFTANDMPKRLGAMIPKVRTIAPGNSQENPAELFIKLTNKLGRKYSNWTESSFHAKSVKNVANPDRLATEKLPSMEEAYIQVMEIITEWNNKRGADGLTPLERFKANRHPQSKVITPVQARYGYGNITTVDVAKGRGYVKISHKKSTRMYTIPDYEKNLERISKACGWVGNAEVEVRFDENAADLYTLSGEYILTCEATQKAHKSYAEATEDSADALGRLQKRKAAMDETADEMVDQVKESMSLIEARRYEQRVAFGEKDIKETSNTMQDFFTLGHIVEEQEPKRIRKQTTETDIKKRAFNDL